MLTQMYHTSLPHANEVWGKVIFSEACDSHSVHGRHAWQGDMHGRGTCVAGTCVAGGHAWQEGEEVCVHERRSIKQAVRILLESILVFDKLVLDKTTMGE